MPANLLLVPYGPEATGALRSAIASAQAGDPLAPVTVAVPSNYAGLALRRQLAREGALLNVRFLVLPRVAELLGAPSLAAAGKRPLTPWLRAEAVRAALADHIQVNPASMFASIGDHLATEVSLDATFRDLREAGEPVLERIATSGTRAREVVSLFRRYRQVTAGGYYDSPDLAAAAAGAVDAGSPTLRDIGHVVLYLPRALSESEATLIDALADRGLATVILGVTGSSPADAASRRMEARLSRGVVRPALFTAAEPPIATHVVAVTDTHEEVRMVARLVMQRLRSGTPLYRMAVLYPVPEKYAAAVHEQFQASAIPHNGPSVVTLAQCIAGRFLLAMIELEESGYRRDAVMDWLTSAPVIEPGHGHVPTGWWDTISRAAGVVAGPEQWAQRLATYERALKERQTSAERPLSDGQQRRVANELTQVRRLRDFIHGLATDLAAPGRSTWKDHGEWARGLLKRYLGHPDDLSGGLAREHQEAERAAYEQVLEQLANLEALDVIAARAGGARTISSATFMRALDQLLQSAGPRVENFGTGVFTAAISHAAGMEFDTVFILGMVEGQAPAIGRDDPLLPDREREAAGPSLPLRASRRDEETRNYLAALATARERFLLFPAADLGGQQKHLPSRWLLESATRLSGATTTLGTKEFLALPPATWLTRVPSFQAALDSTLEPALAQEYDLRNLTRGGDPARYPLALAEPSIGRGIEAIRYRGVAAVTRFDGFIGPRPELRPSTTHPASPTALQTWATCPFSYFLKNVIHVSEQEDPEDILVLSPAERGNIIHAALDAFMKNNTGWRGPWTPAHLQSLLDIAGRLCDAAEAEGITGKPLLWKLERDRIKRDLEGFLEKDAERSAATGFYFLAGEHSFGGAGAPNPPVEVALNDGTAIAFRGRIDRVDQRADGALAVYDYKTGGTSSYRGMDADPTKGGQLLQLPVYALAASQAFPGGRAGVDANYWFVTRRAGYEPIGSFIADDDLAAFRAQLQLIATGIADGLFIANPGKLDGRPGGSPNQNCRYCPYDRLCAQDRRRAWERKQADHAVAPYRALTATIGDADAAH
ncbi:MAG: hypothetical protein C0506_02335 [Anaerolinea sp.]|nr:hypothetical protein [Anaerolinea sp.]